MKLSPGEKLVLLALADAAKPVAQRELDLSFIRDAILDGQLWALDWKLSFLSEANETSSAVADETADILTMWRNIEFSVKKLPLDEQERLKKEAYPYDLEFEGFDGNHDPHFSVAGFLVEKMDRFNELKGRDLNSHSQGSLPTYRRMLLKHKDVTAAKSLASDNLLSADEILSIVKRDD